jgi:hypothetical protein
MQRAAARLILIAIVLMGPGCVNQQYRFERLDGAQPAELHLKFVSLSGVRDGDTVRADLKFAEARDSALIKVVLHLGPPAQFTSGSWRMTTSNGASEGPTTCDSLTYLGGQGDVPSMGGVFTLQDATGRPVYRITMPPTPIARRISF